MANDSEYEFFANINDDEININKFEKLQLENGDTKIKLQAGYHTVYLSNPLKLNSKKFAIGAKVFGENGLRLGTANRVKKSVSWYDYSQPTGKSYLGSVDGDNVTFSKVEDYDFTLKAYTRLHGASNQNLPSDGITEKKREITRIEVKNLPNKREYVQNKESLNLYGGDIKVYYNDGTSLVISMTDPNIHISGFNNNMVGNNIIKVEYQNHISNFTVLIKEDKIFDNTIHANDGTNDVSVNRNEKNHRNSIDSVKFNISYEGKNKKIRISNIKPYILESIYKFSIIMKNTDNDSNEFLIKNNGNYEFEFGARDLKKENDDSYFYDFFINDSDVKNIDMLKKSNLLILNLKEYIDNTINERTGKLEFIEKIETKKDVNNVIRENIDNTVAKGRLPQTGEKIGIFVVILILVFGCIIYKIKNEKIK